MQCATQNIYNTLKSSVCIIFCGVTPGSSKEQNITCIGGEKVFEIDFYNSMKKMWTLKINDLVKHMLIHLLYNIYLYIIRRSVFVNKTIPNQFIGTW